MSKQPEFEAEIVIDNEGRVTLRNCSQEILRLAYELNPKDVSVQKRMALSHQKSSKRRKKL